MKHQIKLFFFFCLIITSCRKDRIEQITSGRLNPKSIQTEEGSEGLMEFAAPTANPYTLSNMQFALNELHAHNQMDCDTSIFNIRVTHKYIKFIPADSSQYEELIDDTTLILFDYPLDRKITKGGTYYRDSTVEEGQPNFQWTCVPANKELPSVPYEVLAELYLPEEDPELIQYDGSDFDDCITLLIDEALKLTGNYDTLDNYNSMTDGGEISSLPSKWTPSGCIKLEDNVLGGRPGLQGVLVHARRWFEIRESITDANGNFNVGHQFRYKVNYSIKWERKHFNIRSGKFGQAYFNGPENKQAWNLDIVRGTNGFVSWFYGHVHRGAYTYYYNNTLGIKSPPKNDWNSSRIAFAVCNEKDRAFYRKRNRLFVWPEIYMFTSEDGFGGGTLIPNAQRLYETTIHELAHASHFDIDHSDFRNTDEMSIESWAVGVAWSFARLQYTSAMSLQDLRINNATDNFDIVHWGERQYTPLVIDLIDNINQRTSNNGNTDFPIDNVSGYTIKQIEDALKTKRTMNAWRDNIKSMFNNSTENSVDELFLNYTNVQ